MQRVNLFLLMVDFGMPDPSHQVMNNRTRALAVLNYEPYDRLRLVELRGYIPCPDHRIAPDAKWKNLQYYCERMRKVFG
jgi:hypothetical protein